MSVIVPTITASDLHEYRAQMELVLGFASRVHIDLMDGDFAPTRSPRLSEIWLPENVVSDLHIMYRRPQDHVDDILRLRPSLVVVHAESECNIPEFAQILSGHGIRCGVALLPSTTVIEAKVSIEACSHCLIFAGKLGYHGGIADMAQTQKIPAIKSIKHLELAWDGGINIENARELTDMGIDVLNTGGAIQGSRVPQKSFQELCSAIV